MNRVRPFQCYLLNLLLLCFLWPADRASAQTVRAWGDNTYGQRTVPTALTSAVAISAGGSHSLALKGDGTIAAWGDNRSGQRTVPTGLGSVVAISAGYAHSLAVRADGTVAAWGSNSSGQSTIPAGLGSVVAVAAGRAHSLALKVDGTVAAWGSNSFQQCNVPVGLGSVVAIAAGHNHSLALRADGTVTAWGLNSNGQATVPEGVAGVVGISAGLSHSLALKADGTVTAWGLNSSGQSTVPAGLGSVVSISAGSLHSLALKADGTIAAWGSNTVGQRTVPAGLSGVVAISGGDVHSLAVTGSATIPFALVSVRRAIGLVGQPFFHRISTTRLPGTPLVVSGLPAGLVYDSISSTISGTPEVPGNYSLQLVVEADGASDSLQLTVAGGPAIRLTSASPWLVGNAVTSWFSDPYGGTFSATGLPPGTVIEPTTGRILGSPSGPPGSYAVSVTSVNTHGSATLATTIRVTSVVGWGSTSSGQSVVPAALLDAAAISAGGSHSLTLNHEAFIVAWGLNSSGQSTNPTWLGRMVGIAGGGSHSLGIKVDGTVGAWGLDTSGQCSVPAGLGGVVAIAAGNAHSLSLKVDGTVAAWGLNTSGQCTVPPGLESVVAIAAGRDHSLALKADGTVAVWGSNDSGQSTVPPGLSSVVAIAGGGAHSMALRADGTVIVWGNNDSGQGTVPPGLGNVVAIAGGGTHSVALRLDGTVAAWGGNNAGQRYVPAGLSGVTAIAAGHAHTLALAGAATAPFALVSSRRAVAIAGQPFFYRVSTTLRPDTLLAVTGLPAGLVFDSATRTIAGIPEFTGSFTIQVAPAAGGGGATLDLAVTGGPVITQTPSTTWLVGNPVPGRYSGLYGATFTAMGLPPGTEIEATTGRILGSPTGPTGDYAVTVTASNAYGSLSLPTTILVKQVVAWGGSPNGETAVPAGLDSVVALSAGGGHSLALKADGKVMAWGANSNGEITVPATLSSVVAVSAGGWHSLALRADGTVAAWGSDSYGQSAVPAGLVSVTAVAAGGSHSLALKADGTVTAWGNPEDGRASVPPDLGGVVSIAAGGRHSLALKADGTVVAWGFNDSGRFAVPAGLSGVVAIAAGWQHSLALKADGSVVAWGSNSYGQSIVPTELSDVVAIAAGGDRSLALKADGTVIAWGYNSSGQNSVPAGLGGVAIAAGSQHSLALTGRSGASFALLSPQRSIGIAGRPFFHRIAHPSQLTVPLIVSGLPAGLSFNPANGTITGTPAVTGVFAVSVSPVTGGGSASVQLTVAGSPVIALVPASVWSIGLDVSGRFLDLYGGNFTATGLPFGTSIEPSTGQILGRPAGPAGEYSVRVTSVNAYGTASRSVSVWVTSMAVMGSVPSALPEGLGSVVAISEGIAHSLALKADGTVAAWGAYNPSPQTTVPAGLNNVVAVAAGGYHSLALKRDGSVVAWGSNVHGQSDVPAGLGGVVAVAAGRDHSLALRSDGTVAAWGSDDYRQSTVLPGLTSVTAIAAGGYHSLALKGDGVVVAWGDNQYGQISVPAGLGRVVAIATSESHSLALRADGSVAAWGSNFYGQATVPSGLSDVVAIAAAVGHSLALKADGTVAAWGTISSGQSSVLAQLDGMIIAIAAVYGRSSALAGAGDGPFEIVSPRRALAMAGHPFQYHIRTTGLPGTALTIGDLPPGLNYDPATRTISGTPQTGGTYLITVFAGAGNGAASLQLTVAGGPSIYPPPVTVWPLGLAVSGGFSDIYGGTFAATGLPAGTSIDAATGRILGVPTGAPGAYPVGITATNVYGSATLNITIRVATVAAWGFNDFGETVLPSGLDGVVAVAPGEGYSLALKADGKVIGWGARSIIPAGLGNVVAIAAGYSHSLALRSDGTVAAWGGNSYGQSDVPAGMGGVVAIAAGHTHSLVLKENGTVAMWGGNGQFSVPTGLGGIIAVAAGELHLLALKSDGSVVAWGDNTYGQTSTPAGLGGVVAIAAGSYHSLALRANGTVVSWGAPTSGSVPAGLGGVVAIDAGGGSSVALKEDGTVVTWGENVGGRPTIPPGLRNVVAVSTGYSHSLALMGSSSGTPFALVSPRRQVAIAGKSFFYRIVTTRLPASALSVRGLPPGLVFNPATDVISGTPATTGSFDIQVTRADGTESATLHLIVAGKPVIEQTPSEVWPIGLPVAGVFSDIYGGTFTATGLPPGTSIEATTGRILGSPNGPPQAYTVCVTATNGYGSAYKVVTVWVSSVANWGDAASVVNFVPPGLGQVVAVSASSGHALALKSNGTLVGWGTNAAGQSTAPEGLSNVVAIATGRERSLVLKANGTVTAWGYDEHGQSTVPTGLANVVAIAARYQHSLALRSDGTVVAWGAGHFGQTSVPVSLGNVVAIAAGEAHSLALKADGSIVGWGSNGYGQISMPAGLSNVVAIAAGANHSLALKADGTVAAWGSNRFGQVSVPSGLGGVVAIAGGEYHSLAVKDDGTVVAWGASQTTGPNGLGHVAAISGGWQYSLALIKPVLPALATFAGGATPLSIPGPGPKAGCTYRVHGLPAWLTLDSLTGALSGTPPIGFTGLGLMRELRYRAGYTVEERGISLTPPPHATFAAWQTALFGGTASPESQIAADPDGDGLPNVMEFLAGTDPMQAGDRAGMEKSASGFALSLEVLPGLAERAQLRAQFSSTLGFTAPSEVSVPTRIETLPTGMLRLIYEDPEPAGVPRRFARLAYSAP